MIDIQSNIDALVHDWFFYTLYAFFFAISYFLIKDNVGRKVSYNDYAKVLFELDLAHNTIRTLAGNELELRQKAIVAIRQREDVQSELSIANKLLIEATDILKDLNGGNDIMKDIKVPKTVSLFTFDHAHDKTDIRHRYKVLARVFHPDTGGSTELMQMLNRQYGKAKLVV